MANTTIVVHATDGDVGIRLVDNGDSTYSYGVSFGSCAHTDRSGTITTGGTAQVAMAANSTRKGVIVQNTSTGDLRISTTGTASSTAGIKLVAGAYWESPPGMVPSGAISIWGATTGQAFTAVEG
jgi:hypothetical protein